MYRTNYEPNYEAVLVLIKHLDNDALKDLINNDAAVDQVINNCDRNKELKMEKELIMTKIKSIAEYNLSLAPQLESGKSKLKELYESVQTMLENIQEKQSQIRSNLGDLSGDSALALLQAAAAESEEESENVADQFYSKSIEIDEFVEQFQATRKVMHLRRVKADKMKELLHIQNEADNSKKSDKLLPAVPYPIANINMPYFPMLPK